MVLALASVGVDGGDALRGPIRGGFSVAEADRDTGARKYALWGESATPLTETEWKIQSPRLELYAPDGGTNMVFRPSDCLFDRKTQRITSVGTLQMWTGDGYLRMEGEGFSIDLESRRLWVSNRVEAVADKRLFEASGVTAGGGGRPATGPARTGEIVIRSDRLEYMDDRVSFLDQVSAVDAEGRLECQRLGLDLAEGSREVRRLQAEGDVRFLGGDYEVRSGRANYDPVSGRLELEDEPRWKYRQRPGQAQQVTMERERRSLRAVGAVRLELPPGSVALPMMPGMTGDSTTKEVSQESVLVGADLLAIEPRSDSDTGQRVDLQGEVRVDQGARRLRCEELQLETEGDDNSAKTVRATGGVEIQRGDEWMKCLKAEYDAASGIAMFDGEVAWQTQGRSGSADRVWLELAENRHRAEGKVRMRFEEGADSWAGWFGPVTRGGPGGGDNQGASAEGNAPTDIECDRFEYQGTGAGRVIQTAAYEGNVAVKQGERLHLTCESLRSELGRETNQVQSVVADGRVELRTTEGDGYRLARGDRAEYSAADEEIRLTGSEGVDFFVIAPSGVSRGVGRQAVYRRVTDTLVLAGDPAITTPEGELVGREVRYDRRGGVLSATGPWRIRVPLGGIELPRMPVP